ncbi:thioredoxin-dependent thiol peroxidase [Kiloniella sp. b19]|uniref:thioredoxin-dependent thiol peroxidase n=1 Tax=Kiloniella sp. GXU_MW_B19 TaxID=3141326 RepID=UPI0031D233E9
MSAELPHVGSAAPDFTAPVSAEENLTLSDLKGQTVVLYFYPKDSTPGCTTEACDFRDNIARLTSLNVKVIGVSKDSLKRHSNFATKHELPFPLVSDENTTICEDYGVWKEKSMYGKTFMGIERTTLLIDDQGIVRQVWPKVKVKGHVDDVIAAVEAL